MKIMMGDAVRRGYIKDDPTKRIKPLKKDGKNKGILKQDIACRILDRNNYSQYWANEIQFILNLTAASTGMRMGELQGLQSKHLQNGKLLVEQQYRRGFGITDTKTHKSREIPISVELEELIKGIIYDDPESFIFSVCPHKSAPLSDQPIRDALYGALEKAGLSWDEQKEINITFTMMIRNHVPEQKIRMITGHSSAAMTEHYTHMDSSDLDEVKAIQNHILNFPQNEKVG